MNYQFLFLFIFSHAYSGIYGQVSFSQSHLVLGSSTILSPLVGFDYDSVKYYPEVGRVSKVQSRSVVVKNGKQIMDNSIFYEWKICDNNFSGTASLTSEFYKGGKVILNDTSLFFLDDYPLKEFSVDMSTNITEYCKDKDPFFDTTWKALQRTEGILIQKLNKVYMKNYDFMKDSKYLVNGFILSVHKINGKLVKEFSILGANISDDINEELKKYEGCYIQINQINSELECGLKIKAVFPEKIYLNFTK